MTAIDNAKELALAPEIWGIKLRGGNEIKVLAHAYRVEPTEAVFLVLFKGFPNFYVEALRIPRELLPPDFS